MKNSESEVYFHYVIKAGITLFGEEEVRNTLQKFLLAKWEEDIPKCVEVKS